MTCCDTAHTFQCSSASRKFLNSLVNAPFILADGAVSVLFSEPKISQFAATIVAKQLGVCFSALQRAENFSIRSVCGNRTAIWRVSVLFSEPKISQFTARRNPSRLGCEFQCSSASRKFLNFASTISNGSGSDGFSALQRAENFSIFRVRSRTLQRAGFQCSSASRKFLNYVVSYHIPLTEAGFSALQRAENFSIQAPNVESSALVGFQCSSASRKFLNSDIPSAGARPNTVSVLFSEPKISQFNADPQHKLYLLGFSALQRAENFSIFAAVLADACDALFQCSSASRKFLNSTSPICAASAASVSVLFSEPKISQFPIQVDRDCRERVFQCSSASRKFLNLDNEQEWWTDRATFSALQRAENFSIVTIHPPIVPQRQTFSALQRAENFSIRIGTRIPISTGYFQCSSASRKFLNSDGGDVDDLNPPGLSVLFSEPKISQFKREARVVTATHSFSALQRAENFSIRATGASPGTRWGSFSALQRAENFSIVWMFAQRPTDAELSVLFSEPKISQLSGERRRQRESRPFSALQRAENFSI